MDKRDTKRRTIQDLDDSEIEDLFRVLGLELARRDLMVNFTVDVNDKEYWINCGEHNDELEEEQLDYDSSDDTIRIRYQNKQGSTATLTATFYAITMQNNT